ncbi:hypothetical protein BJX96DRAFT_173504 [Aspergillus floccosus]
MGSAFSKTKKSASRRQNTFSPQAYSSGTCHSCGATAQVVMLSCAHMYCPHCLTRKFATAANKMYYLPPQCCGVDIPLETTRCLLDGTLVSRIEDKAAEKRDDNKTYCSNRPCGHYLPADTFRDQQHTCHYCVQTTCSKCKGPSHVGPCEMCPRCLRPAHPFSCTDGTDDLLDLADDETWMRCPGCGIMVDLEGEEYNMTCYCGTKFCYSCGEVRTTYHIHKELDEKEEDW